MGVTFLAHPVGLHLKSIISRLPTLMPKTGGLGESCKSLQLSPGRVRGRAPQNLDFGAFWDLRNHDRMVS